MQMHFLYKFPNTQGGKLMHLRRYPERKMMQEYGFTLHIVLQLRGMHTKDASDMDLPLKMREETSRMLHGLRNM